MTGLEPATTYGEPYQTPDGATVITVSRVRRFGVSPVGVFVIRDGVPVWEPAYDQTPIALIGVLTGLVATLVGTLAILRRPPWPDLRIGFDN